MRCFSAKKVSTSVNVYFVSNNNLSEISETLDTSTDESEIDEESTDGTSFPRCRSFVFISPSIQSKVVQPSDTHVKPLISGYKNDDPMQPHKTCSFCGELAEQRDLCSYHKRKRNMDDSALTT